MGDPQLPPATQQVEVLKSPTLDELAAKAEAFKPTFLYLCGAYSRQGDSIKGWLRPLTFGGE